MRQSDTKHMANKMNVKTEDLTMKKRIYDGIGYALIGISWGLSVYALVLVL